MQDGCELLLRPGDLARGDEVRGQHVVQIDEHLDIECGIAQPVIGKRSLRPVRGAVALGQVQSEFALDERAETDAFAPEQASGELGVEDRLRDEADVAHAGQILGRGVQDPRGVSKAIGQGRQIAEGCRIDEPGASLPAVELHQVGALPVLESRRALGVDREGADSLGQ